MRHRLHTLGVEAQGARAGRHQTRLGDGIPAGKQGHLVALTDQLLGEVGDHALGAAVIWGRHTFEEQGNLSDPHRPGLLSEI